jgi:hypothetical protein
MFEMLPSTTRIGVEAFPLTLTASTPLEALQMSESSSLASVNLDANHRR